MTTDTDKLVESFADAFYEQLKHGDAAHQQWLRKETDKFFAAHAPAFRDRIIASLCGDVEPVAWGIFANNGNIRFWACDKASADSQAAKTGGDVEGIFRASTVATLKAERDALRKALKEAATSLQTIATLAGRSTYGDPPIIESHMGTHEEVRAYANSRQRVAFDALTKGQP